MYLFLAQTPAADLGTELWEGARHDVRALVWLGLLLAVLLLAAWLAARTLVPRREMNSFGQYERREGGGFAKALALCLGWALLAALGWLVVRWLSADGQQALLTLITQPALLGVRWTALFSAAALVALALALVLPMAIFRVRLLRAIGVLLMIAALLAGTGWLLDLPLGRPIAKRAATVRVWAAQRSGRGTSAAPALSPAETELLFTAAERAAADSAKPMRERKEAIRTLYQQLQAARIALPHGDEAALAEYEAKKARYEALLQQLHAEIAARPELAE